VQARWRLAGDFGSLLVSNFKLSLVVLCWLAGSHFNVSADVVSVHGRRLVGPMAWKFRDREYTGGF
jgi:hypothetical protein